MSQGDEMYSMGNIANNNVISSYDDRCKLDLCCAPGTNIVLEVNYTSKNPQTHRKREQICGYRRRGMGERGIGKKKVCFIPQSRK